MQQTTDHSQTVADAHIVERPQTHLNTEENELLKELLRPGASIESVLPGDADPEKLWRTLNTCVRGLNLLEKRLCRLKPIIGRILVMFENKPLLYQALGYDTYSDFMRRGVYDTLGLHHSSTWEAQRVAKEWPQLTPDRFAKIGQKKMNVLHKFATGRDPNAEALLATAESMTVGEFRQYAEQRGFTEPGETVGATIIIHTNQDVYSLFKQLFNDGRVHSIVGSKDHGVILKSMMQECESEWINKYERQQRGTIEAPGPTCN